MPDSPSIGRGTRMKLEPHYDMIIVGGGIQGATLAWEASRNKLSVLLVESSDWGGGTSANSLKVIHGGIRYIQNLNIRRSIQSIREQSLLHHLAPQLIRPLSCSIPIPRKLFHNKFSYWVAFKFYDVLRILCTPQNLGLMEGRTRIHPAEEYFLEGELDEEFMGVDFIEWQDAQVHSPERLVYSFVQSAQDLGSHCYNYVKAVEVNLQDNSVKLKDQLFDNKEQRCTARFVIDTTGPWHNKLKLVNDPVAEEIQFLQGVNIYTQRSILRRTLGLQTHADRETRLLYATPWRKGTLFGTWYFEDKDQSNKVSEDKLETCLSDLNKAFPNANLEKSDIALIHSGHLPLDAGPNSDPYRSLSDKTIFRVHNNKNSDRIFASIIGVKYTTARQASSELLQKHILKNTYRSVYEDILTVRLKYSADELERQEISNTIRSYHANLSKNTIDHLVYNYGYGALQIIKQIKRNSEFAELIPGCDNEIKAEIFYCLESEAVFTLADLLIRRIGIGAVGLPFDETITYCSKILSNHYQWDSATTQRQIDNFMALY